MIYRLSNRYIGALLSALLLFAHPVWALESSTDLQDARTALETRDYPLALSRASGIMASHPYDAQMITARVFLETGRLDQALQAARAAREIAPDLPDPRLIEGLVLIRLKRLNEASLTLRRGLDLAQNDQQRALARRLLRQVRANNPWQFTGSFGLAPSNNINKATTADTIQLTFGQAALTSGQAESGTGIRANLNIGRVFPRENGGNLRFDLSAAGSFYEDSEFNSTVGKFAISGQSPLGERGQIRWAMSHAVQDYDQERLSTTQSFDLSYTRNLARGHRIIWSLGRDLQTRHDVDLRSNQTNRLGVRYIWPHRPNLQFSAGFDYFNRDSQAADTAHIRKQISFGAKYQPEGIGWILSGDLSIADADWDAREALFTVARQDLERTLTLSFQNQNYSYYGLTPIISVTLQRRRSNISLYDISSRDMFIGVTNAF